MSGKLLRRMRIVLLAITMGLSLGTIFVCRQTLERGSAQLTVIKDHLPPGIMIKLDVNDLVKAVVATSSAAFILAIASFASLVITLAETAAIIPSPIARLTEQSPKVFSSTTLPHQSYALLFGSVLTAISLTRLALVTQTHEAQVSAFMDGIQLPDFYVQQQEPTLGVSRVYWTISYVRYATALSAFSLLSACPTTLATFNAWNRSGRTLR